MALLIYLGPLLRGWERIKWRIRETRAQPHPALAQTEQQARIAWRERAFHLAFWSEAGTEKEALIGGLMEFLVPQKYFVVPDTGWSGWDLEDRPRLVQPRAGPRSAPRTMAAPSGCCGCAARCGCRASRSFCCAATPS